MQSQSRRALVWALLGAAVLVYFVDLGGSSIWDANEAFYVETPREMIERGNYVSPTFNYVPRLNKPVLSYWIVAGFYHVFGVSVAVQRLPIAIGAVVLVATAFLLGRAATPSRLPMAARTAAGLIAATGLALSPRLVMFGRRIFIDIYVSMFMALTLLFFALAERYPERRRRFLVLMYVSVGLGVLTKGPVAAALPGLVLAVYLIVHGELRRTREMLVPVGIAIVLAIVVPYYAALYRQEGWGPIWTFVMGENVSRYTEGLGVDAERGPFFYLPVLFSDSFPISAFLVAAAIAWVAERRSRADAPQAAADPARRIRTLLWLWIAVIVLFFSLSAAKQDLYIFPIVPAVAALGGITIAGALWIDGTTRAGSAVRVTTGATGLLLAALGGGLFYAFQRAATVYVLDGVATVGAAVVAGGIAAAALVAGRRVGAALSTLAVAFLALNWVFVLRVLPSFEAYKPVPAFARALEERAAPGDIVATYRVPLPSLVYYTRRHVEDYGELGQLRDAMESDRPAFVVMSRPNYELLAAATAAETCVLLARPTFDVKLRNVLARTPLPDLVLVTNRCASVPRP